jgi:DNA processing protein
LDSDYPSNLRHVFNRPPFLFVKGSLLPEDDRAVAVVGTRKASKPALGRAKQLASQLVEHGITVLSGLAAGIDSAAHEAALDARGRTVAVLGTGIETIYPAKNSKLADRILAEGGALVSQFWPDAPPTRFSFPMRNVVMSGMATGTAVIEANSISGAKMQARLALQHGKRLFLMKDLVMQEEWAQRYAKDPGATVVSSVEDIIEVVGRVIKPPTQLTLT